MGKSIVNHERLSHVGSVCCRFIFLCILLVLSYVTIMFYASVYYATAYCIFCLLCYYENSR